MASEASGLVHPQYRADIDGLRAVAILSVVIFHAFPEWLPGGFTGVDVFFVISGYLISTILFQSMERGTFRFAEFYARRIRRLFPALIVVLSSCLALGWFALPPDDFADLGKHATAGAAFVSNLLLWSEAGYFDAAGDIKPLLHLWSLGIEEQFYLVWPLLLWLGWKRGYNLFAMTVLLALVSFVWGLILVREDAAAAFFSPPTRFWELLCGGLLARIRGRFSGNGLSFLGAAMLLAGFLAIDRHDLFPGALAAIPVAGAMFLIAAGRNAWFNRVLLSARPAVWLGRISYPLYLWHWPLLVFARARFEDGSSPWTRAVVILLSIALAWATYRWVEHPIRVGGMAQKRAFWLAGTMVATVGAVHAGVAIKLAIAPQDATTAVWRQLRWSLPVATADQQAWCRKRYPERDGMGSKERDDNLCAMQTDAPANVLLAGDSLNLSLFPGLSRLDGYNLVMLSASSAAPLYNVRTTERQDRIRHLNYQLTNHALDQASADPRIKVVVLSFIGGPALARADSDYFITDVQRPERTDARAIFVDALSLTAGRLTAAGKRVVFVLPNAELAFQPRSCLLHRRSLRDSRALDTPCAQGAGEHLERGGREYRAWVAAALAAHPEVTVFDAATPLCDAARCWAMQGGHMLYRDRVHLSNDGSDVIAPALRQVILAQLRR